MTISVPILSAFAQFRTFPSQTAILTDVAAKDILRQYDDNFECFSSFTVKLQGLVAEVIETTGVRVHSVTGRTKNRPSLQRKLRDGRGKYSDLNTVTDICGVRVITYLEDDVDKVATAIEAEFDIDRENSVDKRALLDPDRFGYLSLHYVVSLPQSRSDLLEYRRFRGLKSEIQVRSILQHAWAEIEHDLGYKTAMGVPRDIRREFSRLAGLLEIADREFVGIRDRLASYEERVVDAIRSAPDKVLVDKASLIAFVKHDTTVSKVDSEIGHELNVPVDPVNEEILEWHAAMLQILGINNIAQLRDELLNNQTLLVRYGKAVASEIHSWHGPVHSFGGAISLMYLILIRAVESKDAKVTKRIFGTVLRGNETVEDAIAEVKRALLAAGNVELRG